MRKILIMTHGGMAKGILSTLSIFMPVSENVTEISAYIDDCNPIEELEKFWTTVSDEDQVIICTDIMGGSVNQLAIPYMTRPNTYLFAGFNFPMLLQLMCLDENASEEEIKGLVEVGKESIICMNDYEFEEFGEDDE